MSTRKDLYPVVVIGAGPAGLAASMQLARQGIDTLVLEKNRIGGLLWNANLVENYPGFPGGIRGPDLVKLFADGAERLGVAVQIEQVSSTVFQDDLFSLETTTGIVQTGILVAASGTAPRKLPASAVGEGAAGRIFSEVYPLLGCQGKRILIVGAGDAAFDYALNLAGENQVTILNKGSGVRALPLLIERVGDHSQIRYREETQLNQVSLDSRGVLMVAASQRGKPLYLEGDYLLAAIGREPDLSFADHSIMKRKADLVKAGRLFLIGDLVNGSFRQTAIAVGDGIRAAMEIGHLIGEESL